MLKKAAIGCLVLMALAAVAGYATWRRLTSLPDWYDETARQPVADTTLEPPAAAPDSGERVAGGRTDTVDAAAGRSVADSRPGATRHDPPPRGDAPPPDAPPRRDRSRPRSDTVADLEDRARRDGRVELDERSLNELLHQSLDDHENGRRLQRAVKAVRARLDGDRLEVGVVANLAALEAATANSREASVVRRRGQVAPWPKRRDFYLAVAGRPGARNGNVFFGRDVELKVGGIAFDVLDLAARLGIEDEELDRGLELPISGFALDDVEVAGGSMVMTLAEE